MRTRVVDVERFVVPPEIDLDSQAVHVRLLCGKAGIDDGAPLDKDEV